MSDVVAWLTQTRIGDPRAIAEALAKRRRRERLFNERGTLFLIAADHPARGSLAVGRDERAMSDRGELLERLRTALRRPGVDGVMATADVIEDLVLLGALEDKVVFGSMNRGGLSGAGFELDDGFTCYSPEAIHAARLDGGKMMVRIADDDPGTLRTLEGCARAIDSLAQFELPAMIEVFAVSRTGDRLVATPDPRAQARAIAIASALGGTSAYTWLKVAVPEEGMEEVLSASTLPTFLLGGDPGPDQAALLGRWEKAMAYPQVRGLVVGRSVLYPPDGDVSRAVDEAASIVGRRQHDAYGEKV